VAAVAHAVKILPQLLTRGIAAILLRSHRAAVSCRALPLGRSQGSAGL
jgi:hypothetical protein